MALSSRAPKTVSLPRLLKLAFLLVVALFWVVLVKGQWAELSAQEWRLDLAWAGLSILGFALYFLGLGVGWALLVRAMGYPPSLAAATRVWTLSMPARYMPGNLWHIATRVRLSSHHGVSSEGVLVSSTVEQALTVLSAACLGIAWLPVWAGAGWGGWAVLLLLILLVGLQPPVVGLMLRVASRIFGKPAPTLNLSYRRMVSIFLWFGMVNAANGMAFFFLATAMDAPSAASAGPLASAYCLAYVVGYISFLTPSGLGVREVALTSMLALTMPVAAAITLGLLARVLSMAGEAVAVLVAALVLGEKSNLVAAPRNRSA